MFISFLMRLKAHWVGCKVWDGLSATSVAYRRHDGARRMKNRWTRPTTPVPTAGVPYKCVHHVSATHAWPPPLLPTQGTNSRLSTVLDGFPLLIILATRHHNLKNFYMPNSPDHENKHQTDGKKPNTTAERAAPGYLLKRGKATCRQTTSNRN